jgi:hypothetical protein
MPRCLRRPEQAHPGGHPFAFVRSGMMPVEEMA